MEVSQTWKNLTWLLLRLSAAFVFIWFAVGKLFLGAVPPVDTIITFWPADVSLFLLGMTEAVVGILLVFGLFTRFAGAVASLLYLTFIVSGIYLGLFDTAFLTKDIGLFGATLALMIFGAHSYSIDGWLAKKKK